MLVDFVGSVSRFLNDYVSLQPLPTKSTEPLKSNNSKEKIVKPQRTINNEKLKIYFSSTFKGMGNGNINHFDIMIVELNTDRTAKEFAQIALMIYDSNKMNDRKPKSFNKWYESFCECVGCEKKTYKPNDLKPLPKNLTKLFSYL